MCNGDICTDHSEYAQFFRAPDLTSDKLNFFSFGQIILGKEAPEQNAPSLTMLQ